MLRKNVYRNSEAKQNEEIEVKMKENTAKRAANDG